ncbi:MAG: hypothetical protein AAF628_11805 [Planctomycetota bacterium]
MHSCSPGCAGRLPAARNLTPALVALVAVALGSCRGNDRAAALQPTTPATLTAHDDTWGFGSRSESFVMARGHSVTLRVTGTPGERARLLASLTPPPAPPPELNGVPVAVDPSRFLVLLDSVIPPSGELSLATTTPSGAATGDQVYLQATLDNGTSGGARLSPGLTLTVIDRVLEPIQQEVLTRHPLGQTAEGGIVILRNATAWTAFWAEHNAGLTALPPLPSVDFTRDVVVAAYAGTRASGGYALEVLAVRREASPAGIRTLVDTEETRPGPGCSVPLFVSRPSYLARVPLALAAPAAADAREERQVRLLTCE